MKFENFNVVVSGATRGIGLGITEKFLNAGARVWGTYKSNEDEANRLMSIHDNRLKLIQCDVRNSNEVQAFFENLTVDIHVLVNNSGVRRDQILASMGEEDWDNVIDTNLKGTYLMSKWAVLNMMKHRFGRIVNISSVGGALALSGQSNYAASKAGVNALTKSLSKEVAKRGITVNSICPGFIETDLISDLSVELKNEYLKQIPMKRFGTVDEVCEAVLFLASKNASYITGTTLDISGGL